MAARYTTIEKPANRQTNATTIAHRAVFGSPTGATVEVQPERVADRRHDPEERRVHELPDHACGDRREDERGHERGQEQGPSAPHLRDEERQEESHARLEYDGGRREDERVGEPLVEHRIAEQCPRVMLEPDGACDLEAVRPAETQVKAVDEG